MAELAAPREDGRSLKDLGFIDIGLDDGWQDCGSGPSGGFHDQAGRPIVDTTRFPDMAGMTKRAHDLGLRASWYVNNCLCPEGKDYMSAAEIESRYTGDVQAVEGYGFQGVKIDHCGPLEDVGRWYSLFNQSGKPMLIENCHWVGYTPYFKDDGDLWCPFNFFRVSGDLEPNFDSMLTSLQAMPKWTDREKPISQPGCWAYLDMLQVGRMPTFEENRAHFAAWAVTSSPLILSLDLSNSSQAKLAWSIVSNEEVLAVNEQWAGHPGMLVASEKVNLADLLPDYPSAAPCDASDPAQHGWRIELVPSAPGFSRIVSHNGLCIDVTVPSPIGLRDCQDGRPSQLIKVRVDGALTFEHDGKVQCIEVAGKIGPVLQRTDCFEGSPKHQRFTFNNGVWADYGTPDDEQFPPRCIGVHKKYPSTLSAHYISWQMWAKPQPGGALAVLVINRAEENLRPTLEFTSLKEAFGDLFGAHPNGAVTVRNLYAREDMGSFTGRLEMGRIPLKDSLFLLLTPATGSALGAYNKGLAVLLVVLGFLGATVVSQLWVGGRQGGRSLVERVCKPFGLAASSSDEEFSSSEVEAEDKVLVNIMGKPESEQLSRDPEDMRSVTSVQAEAQDVRWKTMLQVVLLTVLWWCAAIYVTLMVKLTSVHGAHVAPLLPPFMLTCLVNTSTGLCSWVLSVTCWRVSAALPSATFNEAVKVVALGVLQGCEIGFINKSLQYITISERTMLQNTNVLLLMVTAQVLGLEQLTCLRAIAGLILVGGGVLQGTESRGDSGSADSADHWKGVVFMLSSMLLTSLKWSLIQFMTQRSPPTSYLGKMSKFQLAARTQPITGVVCLLLACLFELNEIVKPEMWHSLQMVRVPAIAIGITVIMCSELKLVQLTSAVAMGVLMNLHHIPMVLAGVFSFHDHVAMNSVYGFILNIVGGFFYAAARAAEVRSAASQQAGSSSIVDAEEESDREDVDADPELDKGVE